jgi:hypothetical protein
MINGDYPGICQTAGMIRSFSVILSPLCCVLAPFHSPIGFKNVGCAHMCHLCLVNTEHLGLLRDPALMVDRDPILLKKYQDLLQVHGRITEAKAWFASQALNFDCVCFDIFFYFIFFFFFSQFCFLLFLVPFLFFVVPTIRLVRS